MTRYYVKKDGKTRIYIILKSIEIDNLIDMLDQIPKDCARVNWLEFMLFKYKIWDRRRDDRRN